MVIAFTNPKSVKEMILEDVQTTLLGIKIANGYHFDVLAVERYKIAGWQAYTFPTLAVVGVKEDKKAIEGGPARMDVKLALAVTCILTADPAADAEEEHNMLQLDVEAAMQVDVSRGGYAIDTTCLGDDLEIVEAQVPFFVSSILFEVRYRHSRTDPTVRL